MVPIHLPGLKIAKFDFFWVLENFAFFVLTFVKFVLKVLFFNIETLDDDFGVIRKLKPRASK